MGPAEIIHGHKDRHYFAGGRKRACLRGAQRQDTRRSLVVAWQRGAGRGWPGGREGERAFQKKNPPSFSAAYTRIVWTRICQFLPFCSSRR